MAPVPAAPAAPFVPLTPEPVAQLHNGSAVGSPWPPVAVCVVAGFAKSSIVASPVSVSGTASAAAVSVVFAVASYAQLFLQSSAPKTDTVDEIVSASVKLSAHAYTRVTLDFFSAALIDLKGFFFVPRSAALSSTPKLLDTNTPHESATGSWLSFGMQLSGGAPPPPVLPVLVVVAVEALPPHPSPG